MMSTSATEVSLGTEVENVKTLLTKAIQYIEKLNNKEELDQALKNIRRAYKITEKIKASM